MGATRLFIQSVLMLVAEIGCAQQVMVYADTGISMHYFKANDLLHIEPLSVGPLIRLGINFYSIPDSRISIGAEARFNFRRFKRNFEEEEFSYRVYALELPIFGMWSASEKWQLQAGANPMFYGVSLKSDPDNTAIAKTGSAFRSFDVAVFAAAIYKPGKAYSLGMRGDLGLIPMAKYNSIGDFGELGPTQTDILYRRVEIFVRWHLG